VDTPPHIVHHPPGQRPGHFILADISLHNVCIRYTALRLEYLTVCVILCSNICFLFRLTNVDENWSFPAAVCCNLPLWRYRYDIYVRYTALRQKNWAACVHTRISSNTSLYFMLILWEVQYDYKMTYIAVWDLQWKPCQRRLLFLPLLSISLLNLTVETFK
jgi:hypothetical protein